MTGSRRSVVGTEWGSGSPCALASFPSPCDLQAPKLKAALVHSSSEEASGHNRRCSPFRVRFADETLQDTAFRYWERRCARKQTGREAPGTPESSSLALGEQRL